MPLFIVEKEGHNVEGQHGVVGVGIEVLQPASVANELELNDYYLYYALVHTGHKH